MTVYLWDASNYDWQRDADHSINFRAVRADGIAGVQHKATEGHTYTDPHFADFARLVNQGVGFAVVGPYHVAWPDDPAQWDHWFDTVEQSMPWWRDYPGVVNWQIDAEKFDGMPRQPNLAEIHAGADRIMARGGNDLPAEAIVVYAPKWLYGNTLAGLRFKLWASDYGANPAVAYRKAYPGDNASIWGPYSGVTPTLAQYGSRTVIGEQSTCDASAVRVANEADLQALFRNGDDVSAADVIAALEKGGVLTDVATLRDRTINPQYRNLHDMIANSHAQQMAAIATAGDPAKLAAALLPPLVAAVSGATNITEEMLQGAFVGALKQLAGEAGPAVTA